MTFKNDLQLLETFGIVVPSKPRKRKPVAKAPTEAVAEAPKALESPEMVEAPTTKAPAAEVPVIEEQP